jgi:hypothetical protein
MIDEKYYKGFEYEIEVIIYYLLDGGEKKGWKIWEGYFETLFSGCYFKGYSDTGILSSWNEHIGFYDEKPWAIKDNSTVVHELIQFSTDNIETTSEPGSDSLIQAVSELKEDLLLFFKNASENKWVVFIEYD